MTQRLILPPCHESVARDYAAGETYRKLQYRYHIQTRDIQAALLHHGMTSRPRGIRPGTQAERRKRKVTYRDQLNGDRAIFAAPCERRLCHHGLTVEGKPLPCTTYDLGECDRCRVEHSLEYYAGSGAASGWDTEIVGVGR